MSVRRGCARGFEAPREPPRGRALTGSAPDGAAAGGKWRFLFVTTPTGGRTAPFTVVVNWAAALKR